MASIVERAALGHGKLMTELYELSKDEVYALCCALVSNEAAATVAAEVLQEGFALAAAAGAETEEAYTHVLVAEAAKRCAASVLDGAAPQAENTTPKAKFVRAGAVFNGSVKQGLAHAEETLKKLSAYQRFAYICATVGGLSFAEIGNAMGQREAIARYCVETANYVMTRMPAGEVRTDQIASLFKKAAAENGLPEQQDAECRQFIAANTKRQTPLWKILTPIAAAAVVIALVLVLVLSGKNGFTTSTSGDGTSTTTSGTGGNTALKHGTTTLDLSKTYYADIDIKDYGKITVKLDPKSAPITVENFVKLAQDGFYDGLTFHRIIEDFMMQGGDPLGNGTGGSEKDIVGEFLSNGYDNALKHTRGAISMARSSAPDSASSQFFIVHKTSDFLDGKYAVFGYVTEGMDVVDEVCEKAEPIDGDGAIAASQQPVMNSVKIRIE